MGRHIQGSRVLQLLHRSAKGPQEIQIQHALLPFGHSRNDRPRHVQFHPARLADQRLCRHLTHGHRHRQSHATSHRAQPCPHDVLVVTAFYHLFSATLYYRSSSISIIRSWHHVFSLICTVQARLSLLLILFVFLCGVGANNRFPNGVCRVCFFVFVFVLRAGRQAGLAARVIIIQHYRFSPSLVDDF